MNDIFNTALKHLSAKNHSSSELASVLSKEFSEIPDVESLVQQTIERLKEIHLINDDFIASSQAQRYRHKGNRYIAQKLQQKGFDKAFIDNTLDSLPSELERGLIEARKKLRTLDGEEPKKRETKLLRFLSGRGFGANTCYQIIDELKTEQFENE